MATLELRFFHNSNSINIYYSSLFFVSYSTQAKEHDDARWLNYIKKLIKHSEEIIIDGEGYVPKCLNKIFTSSTEFLSIIEQFLSATTTSKSKTFFSNFLNDQHSLAVLYKFKFCLLDLFKELKAESKLHFMDVTMNLFLNICNYDLTKEDSHELSGLFEQVALVLADSYFVTAKSGQYFAKNTEPKQLIAEAPRRSVSAKPLTTLKSILFTIDTPQPERPPISTTATAFTIDTPKIVPRATIPRALTSHRRSIRDR